MGATPLLLGFPQIKLIGGSRAGRIARGLLMLQLPDVVLAKSKLQRGANEG
jgi:hypothetical protein